MRNLLKVSFATLYIGVHSLFLEGCALGVINVGKGAPPNGKIVYSKTKYRLGLLFIRGIALNHPEEAFRRKMGTLEENYTVLETQTFGDICITLFSATLLQPSTYEVVK